jgi:hypothetical protein
MEFLKAWTANLSPDEVKRLVSQLRESDTIRERLISILDQRMRASVNDQHSSKNYDSPNWAYKQADAVGYQRAMKEVINLLTECKGK